MMVLATLKIKDPFNYLPICVYWGLESELSHAWDTGFSRQSSVLGR